MGHPTSDTIFYYTYRAAMSFQRLISLCEFTEPQPLTDNIILANVNIVTDISDHFSQVCVKNRFVSYKGKSIKLRDYSKFSAVRFNNDLSNVHWDDIS